MRLSGIYNNQPLVYGIIGSVDSVEVNIGNLILSSSAPNGSGAMLIDTGAQVSVLDLEFALSLDLPETDTPRAILGVAGRSEARQFTGLLHLPEWNITVANTFVSLPLQKQHNVLALIGMDILSELVFTLDGPSRSISLSVPSNPKHF